MIEDKKELQSQISELIHKDIVEIVTAYSKNSILNLELIIRLVQDITLLKAYDVRYIHNDELNEIINLMENELKDFNMARSIALLNCFIYLKDSNQDFKKLMYINLSLRVSSDIIIEAFSFFNVLVSNVKELYKDFMIYIFNDKFLELDQKVQIETIYKIWNSSQQLYHDNSASKFAYENLKLLFDKALASEKTEVAFWLYYTPLHYFHSGTGSDIDILNEKFKNEIEKPLEKYIIDKLIPEYDLVANKKVINKNGKIKVAFVMQRIIRHSTMNVFYSLAKLLMKRKNNTYEFIIYDLSFPEAKGSDKFFVKEFKELGIRYINLHQEIFANNNPTYSLLEKCIKTRNILITDEIDILIGLHTRIEYIFLYATRTAAKQIYWYHSSNAQYDIIGIDFRIKHGDFLIDTITHDKYNFLQFGDVLEKKFLNRSLDETYISKEREKYPRNCLFLGTIGRISKLDSNEYIAMIDEILKENKNVIYIAAGEGDYTLIKSKIDKENLPKWFFPGFVDPHLYGQIIDVWPNTFPNPQGLSTLEFMAKGKPVLTMKNNLHNFEIQDMHNNLREDKFKDFKMNVSNVDEYKRTLNFLISNKEARELIGKLSLEYIEKNYYDATKSLDRFFEILEEISF